MRLRAFAHRAWRCVGACLLLTSCSVPPSPASPASPEGETVPGTVWRQVSERTPPPEPPLLEIGDLELTPFLSTLGRNPQSPPESFAWPELENGTAQVRILTSNSPIRVVLLSFPRVDERGIPDESTSTEERCVEQPQPRTGVSAGEVCVYHPLGDDAIHVQTRPHRCSAYHVLQATWIRPGQTPDGPVEEYVSYAWKDSTPTCVGEGTSHGRQ